MSKKYTPSFAKNVVCPDDTPQEKPLVNTSLPAREAPKLVPATMAALTSTGDNNGGATGLSFGSKFAKKVTTSVSDDKPIDCTSQEEFPSLISTKPKAANTTVKSVALSSQPRVAKVLPKIRDESEVPEVKVQKSSWASMAKSWAKQTEEEEAAKKERELQEENRRKELEALRKSMPKMKRGTSRIQSQFDMESGYNKGVYDDDSDDYEVPEGDVIGGDSSGDEYGGGDNQEERGGAGWEQRRHYDDLY